MPAAAATAALGWLGKQAGNYAWENRKNLAKYACNTGVGKKYGSAICDNLDSWMNESTSLPPVNTVSKKRKKSAHVDEFEPPARSTTKKKTKKKKKKLKPLRKFV